MIKDDKKDTKDKELQEASVKFLPFVGDNYEHGISFDKDGNLVLGTEENQGKKVLVLGESHYCDGDCCDCGNFKLHKECAEFTRNVINEYLDESKERQNWMRTFLKFERALSNADPNIDSNSIWNHLIFYNYLQRPLRGTRMAGGSKDYENAATPFYAILKMFKPDSVIVWGRRLFANLLINMERKVNICRVLIPALGTIRYMVIRLKFYQFIIHLLVSLGIIGMRLLLIF